MCNKTNKHMHVMRGRKEKTPRIWEDVSVCIIHMYI